jgi:hypothetical protein
MGGTARYLSWGQAKGFAGLATGRGGAPAPRDDGAGNHDDGALELKASALQRLIFDEEHPLTGRPGFLQASHTVLRVAARPQRGDPLRHMPAGQPIGMIAFDFAARRRMRINGTLAAVHTDGLTVDVDPAYGNCPRYIQQRDLIIDPRLRCHRRPFDATQCSVMTTRP